LAWVFAYAIFVFAMILQTLTEEVLSLHRLLSLGAKLKTALYGLVHNALLYFLSLSIAQGLKLRSHNASKPEKGLLYALLISILGTFLQYWLTVHASDYLLSSHAGENNENEKKSCDFLRRRLSKKNQFGTTKNAPGETDPEERLKRRQQRRARQLQKLAKLQNGASKGITFLVGKAWSTWSYQMLSLFCTLYFGVLYDSETHLPISSWMLYGLSVTFVYSLFTVWVQTKYQGEREL
jgi:hypothetical protein